MRYAFLVLLARGPAHGYELKQTLDQHLGDLAPPVNAGQVYTTLGRLERDGLVEGTEVAGDGRGKRIYALTEAGRAEINAWLESASVDTVARNEFATKLLLGGLLGVADPGHLIDRQRREILQTIRDLEARRTRAQGSLASDLLIENAALHAEAELRWLDYATARIGHEQGAP